MRGCSASQAQVSALLWLLRLEVNDEDVPGRIVGFNVGQRGNVTLGIARSGTPGQHLSIAHPQRSIDPGLLRPTTVIHRRFDAVPVGRPTGCWGKGPWNYRSEFVGADGRRPF